MRATVQQLEHGKATVVDEDEIDMALLDTVTIAGSRFDRMIKKLMTMSSSAPGSPSRTSAAPGSRPD